jgi:hypothetical protein
MSHFGTIFPKICYFEFRHIGFFICKKWHFSKFTLNRFHGWVMYYRLFVVQNFTGSEEYKILYQIRPEIYQLVIDRFHYLNIVDVMQAVRTWAYKLSIRTCISVHILLLLPVMCLCVTSSVVIPNLEFFLTSHCGWTPVYWEHAWSKLVLEFNTSVYYGNHV